MLSPLMDGIVPATRRLSATQANNLTGHGPLRPARDTKQVAGSVGGRADLGGLERARRAPQVVRARDAPVPVWRAPHGPSEDVFGRRPYRALPPPQGHARAAPDGLRRLRTARREPRDEDGPAPARLHRGVDSAVPRAVPLVGHLDRLEPRVRHAPARVLPLDAVDLPAPVRARP